MDTRMDKAQALYFRIEALRRQGDFASAARLYPDMALLHAARAFDHLQVKDPDGWIDLFAAVTAWGNAGRQSTANRTIERARPHAVALPAGRENVEAELSSLKRWIAGRLGVAAAEEPISSPPVERGELLDVIGEVALHEWVDVSIFDPITGRRFPSYKETPFHDLEEVIVYRREASPFQSGDGLSPAPPDAARVHAFVDSGRMVLVFDAPASRSAIAIVSAVRQKFDSLLFRVYWRAA